MSSTVSNASLPASFVLRDDGNILSYGNRSMQDVQHQLATMASQAADGHYIDSSEPMFQRRPHFNVAPYTFDYEDIAPTSGAKTLTGSTSTFEIGHLRHARIRSMEYIITVPMVEDGGTTVGENCSWQPYAPYIMCAEERLLGGTSNGSSITRVPGFVKFAHRRLMATHNSHADEAARRAEGELTDLAAAQQSRTFILPVYLPWGDNHDNYLAQTALTEKLTLETDWRKIAECLQKDTAQREQNVDFSPPPSEIEFTVRLRVHTLSFTRGEVAADVQQNVDSDSGSRWLAHGFEVAENMHKETLSALSFAATGEEAYKELIDVPIKTFKNPSVMLFGLARYRIDLLPMPTYVAADNAATFGTTCPPDFSAAGGRYSSGNTLPSPWRLNFLPVSTWQLNENGQRFGSQHDYFTHELSERPSLLTCSPFSLNAALICGSLYPKDSRNGLGHISLRGLDTPSFVMEVVARLAGGGVSDSAFAASDPWMRSYGSLEGVKWRASGVNADGTTADKTVLDKRIDIVSVCRNIMRHKKGVLFKQFREM